MNAKISVPALLFSVAVSGLSAGESPAPADRKSPGCETDAFVHATYVVGSRIKNRAQLEETRFEQFNFMYVMAGPAWKAKDFDQPEDAVLEKLVRGHSYPAGDSGVALVPELIARAHQKKVCVLVSLGGTEQFNPIAGDAQKRALFGRVIAAFVKKYDFDGIEIDWEHTVDIAQHALLMADLRKALNAVAEAGGRPPLRKYFLTTALHTFRTYSPGQAQRLCSSVDWVNIMTYDMGGGIWDRTARHNTPLDGMKKALDTWSVFPPDKICIGLANYGFLYKGLLPGQESETILKDKGRYFSYTELPELLENGWTESYDAAAEAPYYFSPDKTGFITIDNTRSLGRKLEWVLKARYRGVFWWEFHCDYFPPGAGQKYARHPLIDPVTESIRAAGKNTSF